MKRPSEPSGLQLYPGDRLPLVPWPAGEEGDYACRYWEALTSQAGAPLIPNALTQVYFLWLPSSVLPVTRNEKEYANSYVCSPYTHYVTYAAEELYLLPSAGVRLALKAFVAGLGLLLRAAKLNQVVHVNNWLLSTNLYPAGLERDLGPAVDLLLASFPKHAIVFRSVNRTLNGALMDQLQGQGFRFVPSRQIYLYRSDLGAGEASSSKARWLLKRDFRLLEQTGYEAHGPDRVTEEDAPRLAELYRMLYLEKYSKRNPQLGEAFFRVAIRRKLLVFHVLRHRESGRIDAVLGYYARSGVMTTPVFGYDTGIPQSTGLYRMLSAVLLRIASGKGHLLHESSGAAQFKRNRGAFGEVEYSAVYDAHLPWHRRMGWSLLEWILGRIAMPLMKKYKL